MSEPARKVLFVESGRGYGGSIFSLRRLIKSVDPARYTAHVAVFHHTEPVERIRMLGVPVTRLDFVRPLPGRSADDTSSWHRVRNYLSLYGNLAIDTLWNGIRLARYIRREQIAIVHLNNGILENLSAACAARWTGRPCVSHVRGTEPLTKVERFCGRWMSAIIALNRTVESDYAGALGRERIHLIQNGVDLEALDRADPRRVRDELGLGPRSFAIGTFARLVEGKGIPELLAAAAPVAARCPDARFFVVGDDPAPGKPFEARLRRQAAALGLGDRVTFTGWRNDRSDVMAAMDLVVQVSTTFPEGMSLAPLEAMALAKPVIVTDIPGYQFSVDDGQTGFVVHAGDIGALAARMEQLACAPARAAELGRAAREKARREFDVRLTAQRVQGVYDQLLRPPTASGAARTRDHVAAVADRSVPVQRD